jgi:alanine racemase
MILQNKKYLENVGTLKSVISQIRTISAGEMLAMARNFGSRSPKGCSKTIPIGYAFRGLGNIGFIKESKDFRSICMDMLMVDVTEINCTEGDSVIIL